MTHYDLTKEQLDDIRVKIRANKDYQKYVTKRAEHLRRGEMAQAMRVTKMMDEVERKAMHYYIAEAQRYKAKVNDLVKTMPEADQDLMCIYGDALVFLADVLESLVIEVNQILGRTHPDFRIEMFDRLVELGKEAKKHVRMLDYHEEDIYYTNLYGDTADKLNVMIVNQSKSFVNKIRRHEESVNKKAKRNAKVA